MTVRTIDSIGGLTIPPGGMLASHLLIPPTRIQDLTMPHTESTTCSIHGMTSEVAP